MPNWFLVPVRPRVPTMRLFCLPYAGGSAAVYRAWGGLVAEGVEVYAAQLPGRGWRLGEAPVADLMRLADELAAAIEPETELPFAVFGHSMGAWLGLEVVRRLESAGRRPVCFFASGRQAPGLGCTQATLSGLDDAGFVREVQARYGGIPAEIAAERDLMRLLLPALRADIALLERHVHVAERRIETPVHGLVGDRDAVVSVAEMEPWAEETAGGFSLRTLPGGHFYFQPDPRPLLRELEARMSATDGRRASCAVGV